MQSFAFPKELNYLQATVWQEIFAGFTFCGFFRDPQKMFPPKKIPTKNFPAKIYSNADILMVNTEYGIESDPEDEEEYCLEDENTIDNPVDEASYGNVGENGHPRSRCYCNRMTMITVIFFTCIWPYCFKICILIALTQ